MSIFESLYQEGLLTQNRLMKKDILARGADIVCLSAPTAPIELPSVFPAPPIVDLH